MLDVKRLERRWLKYKLSRYLPWISSILLTLMIIIGISVFWNDSHTDQSDINATIPTIDTIPEKVTPSPLIPSNQETTFVDPSMNVGESLSMASEPTPVTVASVPVTPIQPQKLLPPKVVQPVTPIKPVITEKPVVVVPSIQPEPQPIIKSSKPDLPLSINRNESKLDITELEDRFKGSSNPNLGLFIARYHYEHGNYNNSLNYAYKTNEINSKIEESWIIFAKSLVKLGKTEQAKQTLKIYTDQSRSEAAKMLLNSIESGTFQ